MEGRERTRAKDAAAIFASSSPLFCSVWCLHHPHHRQPIATLPACVSTQGEGRAATSSSSGRCHRNTSPPHRHRSPSSQQQGSASTVCHHHRLVLFPVLVLSSSSSPPSGSKGRAPSQPGRATPSRSPCRTSPPCRGVPGHMSVKFCLSSENQGHCRVAAGRFREKGISQKKFLNQSNS